MGTEKWNIWVVRNGKFDLVKHYLDTEVPEVKEVFFPTVLKEKKVGTRLYKKRFPLYSGYVFLRYADEGNIVHQKIKANDFIHNYVGTIKDSEVDVMREKESWNVIDKSVNLDDKVEVMAGPMKGFKGTVIAINGNKLTIKVELFGRETDASFSADDIEIIGK
jgi:transcription antitermination factor NusG